MDGQRILGQRTPLRWAALRLQVLVIGVKSSDQRGARILRVSFMTLTAASKASRSSGRGFFWNWPRKVCEELIWDVKSAKICLTALVVPRSLADERRV